MNKFETIVERGVFPSGRRFKIMATQYEFNPEIWSIIKAFMIDFDPIVEIQSVHIPRWFVLDNNLAFPFRKANNVPNVLHSINGLIQFTEVSEFKKLLMNEHRQDFMTKQEAKAEDDKDGGLVGYFLPQQTTFLVDFQIQDGGSCCPVVIPTVSEKSRMIRETRKITDTGDSIKKLRKRKVMELCNHRYTPTLEKVLRFRNKDSPFGVAFGYIGDTAFVRDT